MPLFRLSLVAAATAALAGCATVAPTGTAPAAPAATPAATPTAATPGATPATGSAPAAAPATAGARPPGAAGPGATPPGPPPFDTVVKDAQRIDGLLTVWRKDDKAWIELKPEDFGKAYYLSPKLTRGLGESGIFGGTMYGRWGNFGRAQIVEFKRLHNQVQLLARNVEYFAPPQSPTGRAVAEAYSPSLMGSAAVASQAHPERKTVLVELNALFLGDLQGLGMSLQRAYRQNYAFDARNSSLASVRGKPEEVVIETLNHYATPVIAIPQPGPAGAPPQGPQPTAPRTLPDARSLFIGVQYSIGALPAEPMRPRLMDPRVGYFHSNINDFTTDLPRSPRQRVVSRWRLEKKDPAAPISEPVKPITFWIDRNIPLEYRQAITEGILEWNKAYERIGFRNAVVVQVQPDDADWSTLDFGVASVRWMTNAQPQFGAIGPSQVDPRTGEILDADISFESLSSRALRTIRSQILNAGSPAEWAQLMQASDALREGTLAQASGTPGAFASPMAMPHLHGAACMHADYAAEQMQYAMDVLEARGELDPDGPEARQFVLDYLKDVTMHEVGHTLGLRHNFRSSRIYTDAQLRDEAFTRANSLAGSVMEYAPINLARAGERNGTHWQLTLGPYDYWAIEYAYKPIAPENEAAELQRIAARSAEPLLAYGTDEDNILGIDPESLHFDLGSDPVAFAQRRFDIARELLDRQAQRPLDPTRDYAVLRRSVTYAVREVARAAGVLARQVGGIRTLRDFPGSGRDPLVPVAADVQRAALDNITRMAFSVDSFQLAPALQRRLAPDFAERGDALFSGEMPVSTDYTVAGAVLDMQRALLAQLLSDGVAQRLLDSEGKFDAPAQAFRVSELHGRLTRAIWSELGQPGDIAPMRRELQREHVNRLTGALLRPNPTARADGRALVRAEVVALLARVQAASRRAGVSAETRAHLQDVQESMQLALQARVTRGGT